MTKQSKYLRIIPSNAGYVGIIVRALVESGWRIVKAPIAGRLSRNRQLLILQTPSRVLPLRLFIYKVTQSSRGRDHERRVEITSTYSGSLVPTPGYSDVVLGIDPTTNVFVGLDPLRLHHGGETSNASSFLEAGGLRRNDNAPFIILLRQTRIFPEGEYQAFFRPERISEYLLNYMSIHAGTYDLTGALSSSPLPNGWENNEICGLHKKQDTGNEIIFSIDAEPALRKARLSSDVLDQLAKAPSRRRRQLSPEELKAIQQRMEQNGFLGEQFVFEFEKEKLIKYGRTDLASKVDWISRRFVSAGFDILSFNAKTGTEKYIEVKSTEGSGGTFDISSNEWATAEQYKSGYFIYRVINVRGTPCIEHKLRNPVKLVSDGILAISASGWRIQIMT